MRRNAGNRLETARPTGLRAFNYLGAERQSVYAQTAGEWRDVCGGAKVAFASNIELAHQIENIERYPSGLRVR
jgi:hypothetical protein